MNKTLKILWYILCVSVLLFGFSSCVSKPDSKPAQKPDPVMPVEPENNEEKEKAARLLEELAKVRAEAVSLKADTMYPAQFQSADNTADEARKQYESNAIAAAQQSAQRAIAQYRTLINQVKIAELKAKIDKDNLSSHDEASYKKAEDLAAKISGLYESDPTAAFETSEQALNYYETVKEAGFASLVNDAKRKADEAQARCDSVKASAAMKDQYAKTVNRYRAAGIAAGNKKYEQAYTTYMTAADEFNGIYEKVKAKRVQANDAMERARVRQEASSKLAQEADREAPLPENAEGFSEEPVDLESLQHSTTDGSAVSSGKGR